jgi:iron-sulfur cluster insertion protein
MLVVRRTQMGIWSIRMITITEAVDKKIAELIAEEGNPNLNLRVFVQGGGCSGMQYGFSFDEEQNEDDFVIEQSGNKYLVDSMSMQYLQGATVDFKETFEGSNFVISNPNAQTSCGCGSSFSV